MLRGVLPLTCVAVACVLMPMADARTLDLYWVDVEGGAATLIVTPAGESILIDSGNPGGRDSKRIIQAAKDAGVSRIDHLLTTHFHMDHFGGAAEVAAVLPVGTIYDNGIPEKNPDNPADNSGSFQKAIKPYSEIKAKRVVLKPGDLLPLKQASGEKLSVRCIGAMQKTVSNAASGKSVDCQSGKEKEKDTSDNANSLVLLLKYGEFDLFDGGDLTWNNEAKLVCPQNLIGTVDIYDVNHHGLDISNNPLLIRAIEPTVAIMGNGATKGCGADTFATLKSTPSITAIYQLHRNLRKDSENNTAPELIANEEKDCQANYVKVSVAEDSKTYAISIPAKNHTRVFQSR
jgi:competence protein ComEC